MQYGHYCNVAHYCSRTARQRTDYPFDCCNIKNCPRHGMQSNNQIIINFHGRSPCILVITKFLPGESFCQFHLLLSMVIHDFFSCLNHYIEDMATLPYLAALLKICSYFCNTNVAGCGNIFVQPSFHLYGIVVHINILVTPHNPSPSSILWMPYSITLNGMGCFRMCLVYSTRGIRIFSMKCLFPLR